MAAIPQSPSPNTPWLLTGDDPQALRRNAALLRDHLDAHPGASAADVGRALANRAQRRHRAAAIGANSAELRDAVAALAAGEPSQSIVSGMVRGDDRPVLVFPGQGWQWVGMAKELRHTSTAFAERLAECDAALSRHLPVSVIEVMDGDGLDDVELMQPALWAVMVSLARQWESVGISPAAVLGHSQGETAAAVVAGALSVADGARIVTAYARAIKRRLAGHGGMVSVGLSAEATETLIQPWRDRVWTGVLNGPSVTLVTGDPDALTEVLSACEAQDVWARRINMDYAPHCPMVDPVVAELREAFAGIEARPCRIPFYSTVTGGRVDATALDAEYWVANLRSPIRFVDALRSMLSDGYRVFAESSAHPVLGVGMQETFDEAGVGGESVALGTLRRDDGGVHRFLTSRVQLWANGVDVGWDADFPGANPVELPAEAEATSEADSPFADLAELGRDQQRLRMSELVRGHAAAVLGVTVGEVAADVPFRDAGFDSAKAVELRTALNGATGLNLPAAVVYSCPTPADLAERVRRDLVGETAAAQAPSADVIDPHDPIAIVGMACRFPGGVKSPEDLWRIVADGVDAMGEFPTDRGWNLDELYDPDGERRGSSYVREGAFLHDAADFDAEFFGISPREALSMEPQQRLTLEVAWEAMERAGIDPATLKGTDAGVYIGASAQEYGSRLDQAPEGFEGQMLTGTTNSVVSGRVSYTFGLAGPALTVDTACSASLVSLHLALQGLRQGDCSIAIAGGVTVMARPGMFVELSRQRGLAADGRCKAFSAAADGTNWAEGVGMLVVERLSDAKRLGHKVLAVVRGSAVNQDGASNGLSAPSGPAQERVIRHALATAGLGTSDVDAVEAHGTGTKLGDPIEAQAILATYGQGRDASEPVYLGSLKSNIGHAQTTAGVGGVIKMVMSMRHGQLPKTLHIEEPTPHVDWSSGAVALLREPVTWPDRGRARRAAVSSFGISGTNAHVILEHDPETAPDEPGTAPHDAAPTVWHVSGRTPQALAAQAERLAAHVREHPELNVADIAHSLVTTRTALRTRAAVVGSTREELLAGIDALAAGAEDFDGEVVRGVARAHGVGPVFVFPGQGAQWVGMGIELAERFPVFADAMDECAAALRPFTGRDLWEDLRGDIGPIEVVQPLLWAVMVSLAKLWRSFGVEPSAVVGHSQGEVAAAVISGALSLSDGAKVIALRSSLLARRLSNIGSIVSVALPVDEVRQRIADLDGLGIAAVNGPSATVVVGDNAELDALVAACEADDVRARRIPSGYPTHSARVDPLREELSKLLSDLRPRRGAVPMWSTVTGEPVSGDELDADYWFRNMRHTVQLEPVVRALASSGYLAFIEMSAHPVLASAIQDIGEHTDMDVYATGSLRREDGGARRFLTSMADAHVNGLSIDWPVHFGNRRTVELPTYAFQHRRYWLSTPSGSATDTHPLSVVATPLAETDGALLTATLSRTETEWLADHAVDGRVLLSGTAFVELVTRAGEAVGHGRLEELTLRAPLELESRDRVRVQVTVGAPADGCRPVSLHSCPEGSPEWVLHAEGTLAPVRPPDAEDNAFGLGQWPPADADPIDVDHFYATIAEWGYGYGPSYRGITAAWSRGDEVFTEVRLGDDHQSDAARFGLHPGLLDAALHGFLIERMNRGETGLALPFAISGVDVFTPGVSAARVKLTRNADDTVEVRIADATGTPVARLESFLPRAASGQTVNDLYTVEWGPVPDPAVAPESVRVAELADLSRPVPPTVVVSANDTSDAIAAVTRAHELVRAWLAEPDFEKSTLVFDLPDGDPVHAAVAGYLRSALTEHPGRFGIVHSTGGTAPTLTGEPETRGGDDGVEAPLLRRLRGAEPVAHQWNPNRPVWITGGTGTLGGVLARHLVTVHGVRKLLLTSRRGPHAPGADTLEHELTGAGAEISIRACDVTDREAVAALLAEANPSAVIHAAGVLDDSSIENLTPDQLRRVFTAKASSAAILDELTAGMDLDAFVLFSSIAGVIGSGGQANYAAANAYLDALALDRRRRGLPGVSMAWGLWDIDSGMTGHLSDRARDRLSRIGVAPFTAAAGLSMFDAALHSGEPVVVAARLDLAALRDQAAADELPSLYRALVAAPKRPAASQAPLDQRLAEAPVAERGRVLLEVVRANAAAVLRSDVAEIAPNLAFRDAGFDSLTAVELRNRLNRQTGLRLPSTVVFRHPTPAELAERLLSELVVDSEPAFLADVDRLRDNLSGLDAADEHRAEAVTRLRALLRELDGPAADDDLDTATEAEMFALIDRELGLD